MRFPTSSTPGTDTNPERQAGPHAHRVTVSPDNRWLLVNDLGLDRIHIYHLNPGNARLTPNQPPAWHAAPGSGPRALRFHPNGHIAYCVCEMASVVNVLHWDTQKGTLHELQTISLVPEDYHGPTTGCDIVVTRDGRFAYAINRFYDCAVTLLHREGWKADAAGAEFLRRQDAAASGAGSDRELGCWSRIRTPTTSRYLREMRRRASWRRRAGAIRGSSRSAWFLPDYCPDFEAITASSSAIRALQAGEVVREQGRGGFELLLQRSRRSRCPEGARKCPARRRVCGRPRVRDRVLPGREDSRPEPPCAACSAAIRSRMVGRLVCHNSARRDAIFSAATSFMLPASPEPGRCPLPESADRTA